MVMVVVVKEVLVMEVVVVVVMAVRGGGSEGGWYPGNVSGGSPEKNGRIKKDIEITNIPFKTHLIINKQLYSAVLRSSV